MDGQALDFAVSLGGFSPGVTGWMFLVEFRRAAKPVLTYSLNESGLVWSPS